VPEEAFLITNRAWGERIDATASRVVVRGFAVLVDEPPSRGGRDRAPTPLEYVLIALCGCLNVTISRMAERLRFAVEGVELEAEGVLDVRGRQGVAGVPVHYRSVWVRVWIQTPEREERLQRLAELVERYCPVSSLIRSAVPDFRITWMRLRRDEGGSDGHP